MANLAYLWTTFKQSLAEDYTRRLQQTERGIAHCYRRLDTRYFEMTGNKLSVLGIEMLETEIRALETEILENSEEPFGTNNIL